MGVFENMGGMGVFLQAFLHFPESALECQSNQNFKNNTKSIGNFAKQ